MNELTNRIIDGLTDEITILCPRCGVALIRRQVLESYTDHSVFSTVKCRACGVEWLPDWTFLETADE